MKYSLNRPGLALRPILYVLGFSLLAACSVQPEPENHHPLEDSSYTYSLSIDIDASSRRADVEAHYGGEVVVWRPEAGFAVLGLNNVLGTQSLEGAAVELNQGQVAAPEVVASSVQASGENIWSGGENIWSGGENVWSGGLNATFEPTLLEQNADIWAQISLWGGLNLAPHKGAGVKVAVIDSGVDLVHPIFQDRQRLSPVHEWKDFIDGDAYPQEHYALSGDGEGYGHGTGVAGVVLQVAPQARIMPLRVLDSNGVGDVTDVAKAIDHAIRWKADIINLSLGTNEDSAVLNDMIALAADHKIFVIASSGNSGDDQITYPARHARQAGKFGDYLVSVGSASSPYRLSTFSTYGEALEVTAPGEYVYTAFPNKRLGYWSGTSFSTPMVSGTLALMLGEDEKESDIAKKIGQALHEHRISYLPLHVEGFVDWAVK